LFKGINFIISSENPPSPLSQGGISLEETEISNFTISLSFILSESGKLKSNKIFEELPFFTNTFLVSDFKVHFEAEIFTLKFPSFQVLL
jgi:hypothetical protein